MDDFSKKLEKFLIPYITKIENPIILELGVQKGRSTTKFLEICNKNNGQLYSVDIDNCSGVSNDPRWKFFQTRDDDFKFIKSNIPQKIDILFIDTLHEAKHVKKLIYEYYPLIKKDGLIFIDDISHIPYLKNQDRDNFYCEINNLETFEMILSVYSKNFENLELNFSFFSSGLAIIRKLNNNDLNLSNKLQLRKNTLKNYLRTLWNVIKKD